MYIVLVGGGYQVEQMIFRLSVINKPTSDQHPIFNKGKKINMLDVNIGKVTCMAEELIEVMP